FMFAVGGAGVVQVKDEGLAEFRVVLRGQVRPSDRIVGAGALAGAVDPADQVIVVFLFADTGKIGGKLRAVRLVPFPDGMAAEAAARFAGGLALYRVAGGLMVGSGAGQRVMPDESGDGFDLAGLEAELGHLGG